jgi:hypothetical protein
VDRTRGNSQTACGRGSAQLAVPRLDGTHRWFSTRRLTPSFWLEAAEPRLRRAQSRPSSGTPGSSGAGLGRLSRPPPFSARGDAGMAWDAGDSLVLLFGGLGCSSGICGDSWRYASGTWTSIGSPLPSNRFGPAMAYDLVDHYVVMTEGNGTGGAILSDTWKYTLAGGWVQFVGLGGPSPARYDSSMTFDSADGYLLLFGGVGPGGVPLHSSFKFAAGAWSGFVPVVDPGARWGAAMVYDPSAGPQGYTLLFGGSTQLAMTSSSLYLVGGTSPGQGDSWG